MPGGVASGDTGHVMNPFLPLDRVQVAILDRDLLTLSFVQLSTHVQHTRAVVGMQMFHPVLHRLETRLPARGNSADLMKSLINEAGRLGKVHFVIPEAGQLGSRLPCEPRCCATPLRRVCGP